MSKSLDQELQDLRRDPVAPLDLDWLHSGSTFDTKDENNPWNQLPNLLSQQAFNRFGVSSEISPRQLRLVSQVIASSLKNGLRGKSLRNFIKASVGSDLYRQTQDFVENVVRPFEETELLALQQRQQQLMNKTAEQGDQLFAPLASPAHDSSFMNDLRSSDLQVELSTGSNALNNVNLDQPSFDENLLSAAAQLASVEVQLNDDQELNDEDVQLSAVPAELIVNEQPGHNQDEYFDEDAEPEVNVDPTPQQRGISVVLDDQFDVTL